MTAAARTQVLLAAVCFGTTGTAQALGPGGLAPAGVGAARILVGGGLLVAVALVTHGLQMLARLPRRPVVAAAVAVAVYQLAFFAAVADTGVAVGTIVALGSAPAMAGAIEWAVEGRAPARSWAMATALACAGVALLAMAGADASISPLGVTLALVAGASYASYTLAAKRMLSAGHAPETVMAGAFGLGAVALLPVLAFTGAGWLAQPGGAALALFLGIVPTAGAYLLFARGLRRLSAAETATLTLAEPLTAALLGVIVLSERMSAPAALGARADPRRAARARRARGAAAGYRPGVTAVETVTAALRREILAGERPAGERLVEQELCARYGVARHSLRAALRALAAEGLVRVETNRGARVAHLDADEIVELYELRTALEVEAARLALERHGGRLPPAVHVALAELQRACADGVWSAINDTHADLHSAIVAAARSPRIEAAHQALDGELRLFLNQLEPLWSTEKLAADHAALVRGLERDGPAVLREHLGESAAALVAAEKDSGRPGRVGSPPAR